MKGFITLGVMAVAFMTCVCYCGESSERKCAEVVQAKLDVVIENTEPTIEEVKEEIITQWELDLMARVVMSEASVLPYDAKVAVAQTILNRKNDGRWGEYIEDVIVYPNAYSTADNGTPTEECYVAVWNAIEYMPFPDDMFYFRTNYPHDFGYFYMKIGNTYFTTERSY